MFKKTNLILAAATLLSFTGQLQAREGMDIEFKELKEGEVCLQIEKVRNLKVGDTVHDFAGRLFQFTSGRVDSPGISSRGTIRKHEDVVLCVFVDEQIQQDAAYFRHISEGRPMGEGQWGNNSEGFSGVQVLGTPPIGGAGGTPREGVIVGPEGINLGGETGVARDADVAIANPAEFRDIPASSAEAAIADDRGAATTTRLY